MEDLAYRRLLDWYYLHEKPISLNPSQAARLIILPDNTKEVEQVLQEFFTRTEDGWINKRADKEISVYQGFINSGKKGAAIRWGKGDNSPPITPPNQGLIANTNHEPLTTNQEPLTNRKALVADATKDCPHEQIISAYHEILPEMPQVKVLTEKRKSSLKARWREDEKRQDLEFWNRFFNYVRTSDFLMGKTPSGWQADFEWLVNSSNFVKVIEGKYDNRKP